MKRAILASCILLSGCYVDPNTGLVYSTPQYYPQGTQFHQTLVYHYQVSPPNPYYQAEPAHEQAPPAYQAPTEYRPPMASYEPSAEAYNACAARNAERYRYQQPTEDCGVYAR